MAGSQRHLTEFNGRGAGAFEPFRYVDDHHRITVDFQMQLRLSNIGPRFSVIGSDAGPNDVEAVFECRDRNRKEVASSG